MVSEYVPVFSDNPYASQHTNTYTHTHKINHTYQARAMPSSLAEIWMLACTRAHMSASMHHLHTTFFYILHTDATPLEPGEASQAQEGRVINRCVRGRLSKTC